MVRKRIVVLAAGVALAISPGGAGAQTLANGDFDFDVVPWADPFPDPDTVITWSAIDADEPSSSGSLQVQTNVTNNAADGPRSECLAALPGGSYSLSAQVFQVSGAGQQASAQIGFEFYDTATCEDFLDGASQGPSAVDAWELVSLPEVEAPAGTASLRVRALVGTTTDSIPDLARFDQILLVPEPGSGAGAAAALLALAAWRRPRLDKGPHG